ncbi:FAD-binding domain-containing protein [Serendipita vermifera]|nr:FAD-binding domain-containing protein [Serendipita vermifera]
MANVDFKTPLLAAGFSGDLVAPSDPDYKASLARFAKNAQKNAGLVAFVKSPQDVAHVINFASANSIPIVVRGGGHSTSGGSSIEGGIVIDLSRHLNKVRVDQEKRLGYVDAGANWKAVDEEAIKYGLATVGGTVNHTGVGGLTLGGGYGWLTGEHGMTIDNLVEVTMVTADGTIRTVNAETDADLFWAIRGGGPNFGCATQFVYRLYPQRATVYAGPLVYPPPMFEAVAAAVGEWYSTVSEKEGIMMVTTSRGPTGDPAVVVFVFYNGDEEEGKVKFKKLLDLGPVANLAGTLPYEQLNAMQNQAIPYGINYHLNGFVRAGLPPPAAGAIFNNQVAIATAPSPYKSVNPTTNVEEPNTVVLTVLWEFYNLKKQSTPAPDATAFRMRVPYSLATLIATWSADGEEASKEAKERLRSFKLVCDNELRSTFGPEGRNKDAPGYGNNEIGNPQTTDAAEALYAGNYPRLQEIKAKYDPKMLFKAWYPIRPATTTSA